MNKLTALRRSFSTVPPRRHLFLVLAQDHPGEAGLHRRLAVRQDHLENATSSFHHGQLKMGGALLDSHDNGRMIGSVLVVEADTLQGAKEQVEKDVYVQGNVWKSWEIIPYKGALGIK
ncbi:hypothetical protein DM01DRAFT_1381255 [Hesseltinella vesiculosa]|uniref:YCII-related domain-containing protein n=1 Tax=Hesseltinella vesiculosa TaxID=101127 RepID=A0A1X2GRM2_9FUNG|nr:hypothetical protein DM01DRAFT_1381255 [Hesseltinella vesiculosa]